MFAAELSLRNRLVIYGYATASQLLSTGRPGKAHTLCTQRMLRNDDHDHDNQANTTTSLSPPATATIVGVSVVVVVATAVSCNP